jgi:invasion protein IalB
MSLACVAAFALGGAALAQDADDGLERTEFGDWTRVCAPNDGGCALQQLGRTEGGESSLLFSVEKLAEPRTVDGVTAEAVAVIRTPLLVLLNGGLRIQVDSGEPVASPYFTCDEGGCIVQALLRPEQLASFRAGARARIAYTLLQNGQPQNVVSTVSLSGFTRGFNGL